MNFFKIWASLTSMVIEAVRGQKCYRDRILWHFYLNVWFIPQCQFCLPKKYKKSSKCSPINEISYSFQPPYLEFQNQARRACFLVYDRSLRVASVRTYLVSINFNDLTVSKRGGTIRSSKNKIMWSDSLLTIIVPTIFFTLY